MPNARTLLAQNRWPIRANGQERGNVALSRESCKTIDRNMLHVAHYISLWR